REQAFLPKGILVAKRRAQAGERVAERVEDARQAALALEGAFGARLGGRAPLGVGGWVGSLRGRRHGCGNRWAWARGFRSLRAAPCWSAPLVRRRRGQRAASRRAASRAGPPDGRQRRSASAPGAARPTDSPPGCAASPAAHTGPGGSARTEGRTIRG